MEKWTLIIILVLVCLLTSSGAFIVATFPDDEPVYDDPAGIPVENSVEIPTTDVTNAPTPPPASAPAPANSAPFTDDGQRTQVLHFNGAVVLHNTVPLLDLGYHPQRFYLVPGANFPGVHGQTVEQATVLIANSFPQLSVRAVRLGDPVAYEVRRDRLTLQYDAFTRRVVSARIG